MQTSSTIPDSMRCLADIRQLNDAHGKGHPGRGVRLPNPEIHLMRAVVAGSTDVRQAGRGDYPKRCTPSNLAKLRSKVPTGKCPAFLAISSTRPSEKSTAER